VIHFAAASSPTATEDRFDDDPDTGLIADPDALDITCKAAVGGEALSAILERVMIAILGAVPIEQVEPSERAAIRRGIADTSAGRRL
jgi:hypothetical protein